MDTGWGASFPNKPMTIRSFSPGPERPLNSINILSVMAASVVGAANDGEDADRMEAAAIDAKKSLRVDALFSL